MKKGKILLKDILTTNLIIVFALLIISSDQVGLDEFEPTTWKEFIQGIISITIFVAIISFIRNLIKKNKS
jgi:hypothetical protein